MKSFIKKKDVFNNKHIDVSSVNTCNRAPEEDYFHSHDFWEFELFIEGHGIHDFNTFNHKYSKGYCYLLTPADFHRQHYVKDTMLNFYNIKFDDCILDYDLKQKLYCHSAPLFTYLDDATTEELRGLIEYLSESTKNPQRSDTDIPRRIMSLIVTIFELHLGQRNVMDEHSNSNIQAAIIYMQQNFKKKLTRDMVAKVANMSPCYFSDYFKKAMGVSFVQYLNNIRINYAETMIRNSSMSLKEISYDSGFSSFGTFCNAFKKKHGVPPSDYFEKEH